MSDDVEVIVHDRMQQGYCYMRVAPMGQRFNPDFRPDLTIYLDVTPEVGLKRARARGELDRIEQATGSANLYHFPA